MKVFQGVILAAAGLVLASCTTTGGQGQGEAASIAGNVPPNYRGAVVENLRQSLKDPYSVRSAEISQPKIGFAGLLRGGNVPVVCAKFNARNSFGAYTGVEEHVFVFKGGKIFDSYSGMNAACGDAAYAPFPELERAPG